LLDIGLIGHFDEPEIPVSSRARAGRGTAEGDERAVAGREARIGGAPLPTGLRNERLDVRYGDPVGGDVGDREVAIGSVEGPTERVVHVANAGDLVARRRPRGLGAVVAHRVVIDSLTVLGVDDAEA